MYLMNTAAVAAAMNTVTAASLKRRKSINFKLSLEGVHFD